MRTELVITAVLSALFVAPAVHATPTLLAIGSLSGSSAGTNKDLSGLNYNLENGAPADLLGGIGSGLAWAGGNTFIATPDRGPNAKTYNPLVDNTVSYISRFQTITMALTPNAAPGLPYSLSPRLVDTTLLSSATALNYGNGSLGTDATHTLGSGVPDLNATNGTNYFTGRSDGFAGTSSTNPSNAGFDPEGVRVSNDGNSVFISDEYGPYVYQFDRATGLRTNSFALPANLAVAHQGPTTTSEGSPTNTTGRVANKGMEGLAITPDGKTLVGIMQAPLLQDKNGYVRLVTIDIATGTTHEYAYKLTTGSGVSDIVAINNHQFLVDERDGKGLGDGSTAVVKQVFKIDIAGATDVTNTAVLKDSVFAPGGSVAVAKSASAAIDLVSILNNAGIASTQIPAKIESMAFGQDILDPSFGLLHTLYIANDNDFVPSSAYADLNAPVAGPNKFYVIGLSDSDLSNFHNQQIPVPGTVWLIGAGLMGLFRFTKKRLEA